MSEVQRTPCPYCGEQIAVAAKKCRFCGEWLSGSQPRGTTPDSKAVSDGIKDAAGSMALGGCLFALVFLVGAPTLWMFTGLGFLWSYGLALVAAVGIAALTSR